MNHDPFVHSMAFDQKQADQLGRSFNLAFNCALLYGGGHQTTIDNSVPFFTHLTAMLEGKEMLTLSVERESVFFEGWCVDKAVNQRRIVGYFKKAGLQSVTFETGVLRDEVIIFIRMIGDLRESPSVDVMIKSLTANRVKKIRLNYVTYRKVTVDEAVVDKQILSSSTPREARPDHPAQADLDKGVFIDDAARPLISGLKAGPRHADTSAVLQELAPVFSIKKLFDDPKGTIDNLVNLPAHETDRGLEYVAGQIKALNAQVQSGDAEKKFPSTKEMMEAVYKLRQELILGLDVLKATGRVLAVPDSITEDLDRLSRETVIRIIRGEYRNGTISVKRLAQVIRRIMPDMKELKKLLPHLKAGLMSDGMSLTDYLQLAKSIVNELENDGLVDVLASASDEMGVSVDEVISGIKSDPEDAARLIILASEIRKGSGADTEQLSELLTDYVERVSQKLAVQSRIPGADTADPSNKTAVRRFEDELLNKLKSQGLQEPVVKEVRHRLMEKKRGYELPRGIFDIKATMFFMEHEIKLFLRYNAPFSTLMVSCVSVKKDDGHEYAVTPEETAQIIPGILKISKKMLRDLDIIGVMGKISNDLPFIILPMTDEMGAQAVIGRLKNALNVTKFSCGGRAVVPRIVVTSFEFDKTKTPDCTSYLRGAMAFHKKQLDLDRSNSGLPRRE
jgi:hypothetical protein